MIVLQVMKLRQAKNEFERKVQDQEEELDEQAGTIQQLEQVSILPSLRYVELLAENRSF